MQEVTAHRQRGKVGNKGRLLRTGVVKIGLIGVRRTGIGGHVPQFPAGMPQHIELGCFQNKVLYGNPAPLCLFAILKLLTQIFLERQRKVNAMILVYVPFYLAFHRDVLRLLERRLYAIGEGKDGFGRRPAVFETLDKL